MAAERGSRCSTMKLFLIFFLSSFLHDDSVSATGFIDTSINIIPRPVSIQHYEGVFHFSNNTKIFAADSSSVKDAIAFNELLKKDFGFELSITNKNSDTNCVELQTSSQNNFKTDEYHLAVSGNHIFIEGKDAGVFYGLISLLQLPVRDYDSTLYIPCVSFEDYPRFSWRGMHLDVSRHFFPKEFIERYIDYLARYKFNTFHWHLTDDQGWRIEIKKYPLLTQIGAWRSGSMIGVYRDQKFDSVRYGGYYTQDDVREIVAYARERHVTIVPEIEMPAHCLAALASYPQFSCTGGPFEVGKAWGGYDDIFCPKEETFSFLKDVLSEVCDLFPGKYIHIGGDEVSKTRWKECAMCQQLIQQLDLKDEEGLQSYFINRIDSFLTSKGKQLVGWDEILEGGLSPSAVVMSWRGTDGGIAAAKQNHDVVMSPGTPCYFDHYQSSNLNEPLAIGGYNPVEAVYAYEPVPAALDSQQAKHILGAQGNVWTEYISTTSQVEYMVFPRMCALAEVDWTQPNEKSFDDFVRRLLVHFQYFDTQHINYSKALYDVKMNLSPSRSHDGILLSLIAMQKNVSVHYSLDGTEATSSSWQFHDFILIKNSCQLHANAFMNGHSAGRELTANFQFNKATGKNIMLDPQPSEKYNHGGAFTLVDGLTGFLPWRGSDWLGFSGTNLNAVIDLQKKTSFTSVTVDVLDAKESWIHIPKSISVFVSNDGKNFRLLKTADTTFIQQSQRAVKIDFKKTSARYIKVVAENAGKIPDGFPGAEKDAWLFVDEISVE